jgi:trehalose 6-phosphate synthase
VASHRGPVTFALANGTRVVERGAGGLVTALSNLGDHLSDGVWLCAAISDEDKVVAAECGDTPMAADEAAGWRVQMLDFDDTTHTQFYAMIANPLLWFVQHGLWSLSDAPDIGANEHRAWDDGYAVVNARFADAICAQLDVLPDARVMVHDYHLYLVPSVVRRLRPDTVVSFFCHIPWPHPDAWSVLPLAWRQEIFAGLLGADIVGFQTERSARNFVAGCEQILSTRVDHGELTVQHDGRRVAARWYPISVDVAQLEDLAASPAVRAHEATLIGQRREKMILRVDRTDLSKNILRGFRAYDLVLQRRPELRERVTFLALLQPSRQDVREYAEYLEAIRRTVADLNLRHGTPDWQPVDLRFIDDIDLAVAAYKQYDVLMVNAIADGMNLVAKEAVVANTRDGVLLLSEGAGAEVELGHFAIPVHPFDVEQQAAALWDALTMDASERHIRLEACREVVRRNDLPRWVHTQMDDVREVAANGRDLERWDGEPGQVIVLESRGRSEAPASLVRPTGSDGPTVTTSRPR